MLLRVLMWAILGFAIYRLLKGITRRLEAPAPAPEPPSPASGEKDPHEVLGIPHGASQAEIRAAYQSLVREYHPDRVARMPDEFREVAEQRTKEINAAYTRLKKS